MSGSARLQERATEMFALLPVYPDSVKRDVIMEAMGIRHVPDFHTIKGTLQDMLGADPDGDENPIMVVGEQKEVNSGWEWSLTADAASPAFRTYLQGKQVNIFARQARAWMVCNALCAASPNPPTGDILRRQRRSIARSLEDTRDAMVDLGLTDADLPVYPWETVVPAPAA